MKIQESIAIAAIWSGALWGASSRVYAESEVSSDAIGYYRTILNPGFQSVSVRLVKTPTYTGKIASSTSGTITASYAGANFGTLLNQTESYYAEVINGPDGPNDPQVGHRFEINESSTIAAAGPVLVVESSPVNTRATVPDLAGYDVEVRQHLSLNEVFDKTLLAGGASLGNSDQLFLYNGTSYDTYYILAVGSARVWRLFGGSNSSQDTKPLYPGQGMLFNRKAGTQPVEIVVKGKVRANPFYQPLSPGFNLLSEAFPVSASPRDRNAAPGTFIGSNSANSADQVAVYNGASYDTYYLLKIGTNIAWRKIGGSGVFTDTDIFDYRGSVFMRRINADPDYRVPLQWTP